MRTQFLVLRALLDQNSDFSRMESEVTSGALAGRVAEKGAQITQLEQFEKSIEADNLRQELQTERAVMIAKLTDIKCQLIHFKETQEKDEPGTLTSIDSDPNGFWKQVLPEKSVVLNKIEVFSQRRTDLQKEIAATVADGDSKIETLIGAIDEIYLKKI